MSQLNLTLDNTKQGDARFLSTMTTATTMLATVLQDLGYGGEWRVRPLSQISTTMAGKFHCSRVEPDGVRLRIQPGNTATCWEYLLQCPPGTSPLALQWLKRDLKLLKHDGSVPPKLLRKPEELAGLLAAEGVAVPAIVAATGTTKTKVKAPTPVEAEPPAPPEPPRGKTPIPAKEPLPPKPAPSKPATENATDIAAKLLERKRAIAAFKEDMKQLAELKAERHLLAGSLKHAESEVTRLKNGIQTVEDYITEINEKWPNPERMAEEETNLLTLAQELMQMLGSTA